VEDRALSVRTSDGVLLAGEDSGGDGPPIVLLHGLTATRRYVVMGSRALQRAGHRVIAYDARGHGRSTPAPDPSAYGYGQLAEDLRAVLDACALERAALAGASMGAHTALHFALAHPARVAALGIVTPAFDPAAGASGPAPDASPRTAPDARPDATADATPNAVPDAAPDAVPGAVPDTAPDAVPGAAPVPAPEGDRDKLAHALRAGGVDGFLAAYDFSTVPLAWRETVATVVRQRLSAHLHPDAVADALEVVPRSRPFAAWDDLAPIAAPTVVVASRDEVDPGHPLALAQRYAAAIPGATLAVEDGGPPVRSPLAWQGGQLSRVLLELLGRAGWGRGIAAS
jgi:pimeloyl-ACP methyl ester carboxylesterase